MRQRGLKRYYMGVAAQAKPKVSPLASLIAREIQRVARERGRALVPLTDEVKLLESGLDSLGLAVVVMRLEDTLGIDPFESGMSAESPVTLGEFVRMYEELCGK